MGQGTPEPGRSLKPQNSPRTGTDVGSAPGYEQVCQGRTRIPSLSYPFSPP
jgi:hypothetical protein